MKQDERVRRTRGRILDAAVAVLVEHGVAGATTVAVQARAGVSRGALLHHFPSRAELLAAVVDHVVGARDERARPGLDAVAADDPADRLRQAVLAVRDHLLDGPGFLAELELWAAARTDPELRAAVQAVERRRGADLRARVDDLFGPDLVTRPRFDAVAGLTVELVRGMALARLLGRPEAREQALLDAWVTAAAHLLDLAPPPIPESS